MNYALWCAVPFDRSNAPLCRKSSSCRHSRDDTHYHISYMYSLRCICGRVLCVLYVFMHEFRVSHVHGWRRGGLCKDRLYPCVAYICVRISCRVNALEDIARTYFECFCVRRMNNKTTAQSNVYMYSILEVYNFLRRIVGIVKAYSDMLWWLCIIVHLIEISLT